MKRREKAHRCPHCAEVWEETPDRTPSAHIAYHLHHRTRHRGQADPGLRCREDCPALVPDPPRVVLPSFPRLPREAHCYECGAYLEQYLAPTCSVCGWLLCELCDACGCGYYGFGG